MNFLHQFACQLQLRFADAVFLSIAAAIAPKQLS